MGCGFGYGVSCGNGIGMMGMLGGTLLIFGVLLLVVISTMAVFAMIKRGKDSGNNQMILNENALQTLNNRYAAGEISDEEYAKKKAELKK